MMPHDTKAFKTEEKGLADIWGHSKRDSYSGKTTVVKPTGCDDFMLLDLENISFELLMF